MEERNYDVCVSFKENYGVEESTSDVCVLGEAINVRKKISVVYVYQKTKSKPISVLIFMKVVVKLFERR